jgi:transcriptional regulator with XRE-family HTH domain
MKFSDFLDVQFLAWQQREGRRKTMKEFSEYLGIKQSTISMWYSGQSPNPESLRVLAAKLGPEVYDALDLERPDPDLAYITQQWENLDPATRRQLREQAEKFASKNDTKRISQKRRVRTSG